MKVLQSHRLRIRVLVSLVLFILLLIINGVHQLYSLEQSAINVRLLGEIRQLDTLSEGITRRSGNYLKNAARDYESYNRDVKIFHMDILTDIEEFDKLLKSLDISFHKIKNEDDTGSFISFGSDESILQLEETIQNTRISWEKFQRGLAEKLGQDSEQPRIEWGAEFIVQNSKLLNASISAMSQQYQRFIQQRLDTDSAFVMFHFGVLLLFSLLAVVWFYYSMAKRIGQTVKACHRVSIGEFGYRIPLQGQDELTVLAQAFNTLSSRGKLVLSMLSELQHVHNMDQALLLITQSAGGYLPIAWVGLIYEQPHNNRLRLQHMIPVESAQSLKYYDASSEKGIGRQFQDTLSSQRICFINDLPEQVATENNPDLWASLSINLNIKALMAIPLISRSQWRAILVVGSKSVEYNPQHGLMLLNLAPTIADSLEQISSSTVA